MYFQQRQQLPPATKNLIIINALIFVATMLNEDFMISTFGLFYPTSRYFHFWQPLTHMFMHGGIWHIFFNMFSLWMFGSVIEQYIGSRKFLILFIVAGLGGAALHMGVEWIQAQTYMAGIAEGSSKAMLAYESLKLTPTVGASGAIYGLLITYAMLFPDATLMLLFPPIPMKAKWMVVIFAVVELLTGVSSVASGIAHFAHLGGMLFGWMLVRYWKNKGTLFDNRW